MPVSQLFVRHVFVLHRFVSICLTLLDSFQILLYVIFAREPNSNFALPSLRQQCICLLGHGFSFNLVVLHLLDTVGHLSEFVSHYFYQWANF